MKVNDTSVLIRVDWLILQADVLISTVGFDQQNLFWRKWEFCSDSSGRLLYKKSFLAYIEADILSWNQIMVISKRCGRASVLMDTHIVTQHCQRCQYVSAVCCIITNYCCTSQSRCLYWFWLGRVSHNKSHEETIAVKHFVGAFECYIIWNTVHPSPVYFNGLCQECALVITYLSSRLVPVGLGFAQWQWVVFFCSRGIVTRWSVYSQTIRERSLVHMKFTPGRSFFPSMISRSFSIILTILMWGV